MARPVVMDQELAQSLLSAQTDHSFSTVLGATMCTDDFYEGQCIIRVLGVGCLAALINSIYKTKIKLNCESHALMYMNSHVHRALLRDRKEKERQKEKNSNK